MPDLMQIAGGAAYSRFCDNTLWLENHENKTSTVLNHLRVDRRKS